jgi:hypothetical protein
VKLRQLRSEGKAVPVKAYRSCTLLNLGTRFVCFKPYHIYIPGRTKPVLIGQKAWWIPGPVWTFRRRETSSHSCMDSNKGLCHTRDPMPTDLSQLPSHFYCGSNTADPPHVLCWRIIRIRDQISCTSGKKFLLKHWLPYVWNFYRPKHT